MHLNTFLVDPINYTDEDTYYNLKEKIRECRKLKRPVTDLWTLHRPGRVVSKVGHFVPQKRDSQVQPKSLIIESCDSSADPDIDIIIAMPYKPTFESDTSSDTLLNITKEYAKTGTVVFPSSLHALHSFNRASNNDAGLPYYPPTPGSLVN